MDHFASVLKLLTSLLFSKLYLIVIQHVTLTCNFYEFTCLPQLRTVSIAMISRTGET